MRIAVFSDIHGNDFGFAAMEADLARQHVDQTVCLGDAIQGGPQPAAVVERLRRLGCPVVMGNADDWLLTGSASEDEGLPLERLKKMKAVREWSLSQLSTSDRDFIAAFQPTITIPLGENLNLLCFHGSPDSFNDIIIPAAPLEDFKQLLARYSDSILTGGHTHAQQIRRNGNLFFFNPGSVGFAYSHDQQDDRFRADAWAEYAILTVEDDSTSLEFRRVPYDAQQMQQVYFDNGRPFAEEAAAQYQP